MLVNEKQQEFLNKRVIDGKSLESISNEIEVPVSTLREWGLTLIEQIEEMRLNEIDKMIDEHELTNLKRLRYLGDLYSRLKTELDKRDFSGLPTDKLYQMLTDVYAEFSNNMHDVGDDDWDDYEDEDEEYWDDLD